MQNAQSIDKIFAKYQYEYANCNYKLILVFCDTEMEPYEKFTTLKRKINALHGNKASDKIVIFANPCTMQIIISHFIKTSLKTNSKRKNGKLLKEYFGIEDYRATEAQRKQIMDKITAQNYTIMKNNLNSIGADSKDIPSTNAVAFLKN